MVDSDMCGCCKNIWNRVNLQSIRLGNHKLYLCSDCYKEYESILYSAFKGGYKDTHKANNVKTAFKQWLTN